MEMSELITAVRDHAKTRESDGWHIVTVYTDDELAALIGKSRTPKGAIAKVAGAVEVASGSKQPDAGQADSTEPAEDAAVADGLVDDVAAEQAAKDAGDSADPAPEGGLCSCGKFRTDCKGHNITDADVAAADEKFARDRKPGKPYALIDAKVEMVPVYKGRIAVCTPNEDGSDSVEHVYCPHQRYGHETEQAALKCARAEAGKQGLTVGA